MRELLTIAAQIGEVAAGCSDARTVELLQEAEARLVEASREQRVEQVDSRSALEELVVTTCTKPGHVVVLLDLLGQTWVGYAGAAGAYVARPPSRHYVLEAVQVRASDLWLPVSELDPARFPMLALHAPDWAGMAAAHASGVAR